MRRIRKYTPADLCGGAGGGGKTLTNALTHITTRLIPPIVALFYLRINVIGL